ncbi:MAG: anhydro-N-acetylmuramic acid kinase, partial [Bacteroidota bacterium]
DEQGFFIVENALSKSDIKTLREEFERIHAAEAGEGGHEVHVEPGARRISNIFNKTTAYDVCLNLGGIANLSYQKDGQRVAFDVCPFNIVFNHLAGKLGLPYDDGGKVSAGGMINAGLAHQLSELSYYRENGPKSLGIEYIRAEVLPLIDQAADTTENKLRTFCEHVVGQVAAALPAGSKSILVTGGGGFHQFFISELEKQPGVTGVHIPSPLIVNFKEAMIFAFLGVLRWRGEVNSLSSVTGARRNSSTGSIVL